VTHAVHGLSQSGGNAAPAVPYPRRRLATRVLLPLLIVGAAAALLLYTARDLLWPGLAVRGVPVVLQHAEGTTAEGAVAVQAPGWLEPDPHPVIITAQQEGTVREVLALEGNAVKSGDVVARLIDADALLLREAARADVRDKQAALTAAAAERDAAQRAAQELIERTAARAAADAAVAQLEAQAKQLEAQIAAAAARVALTRDEVERKSKLAGAAVSAGDLERLRLRLRAEEAEHAAALAGVAVLVAQQEAAAAARTAAVRAFELRIDETKNAAVADAAFTRAQAALSLAETSLAQAELSVARTEVRAPADGVVLRRLVSPGARLTAEGERPLHVVHLYDPKKLQVRVEVPLADAALVGVGQRAEVIVEALPERRFAGAVTRLVHEADIARNTVQVKVAITDPDPLLKPEMLARVRLFGSAGATPAPGSHRQRVLAPRQGVRKESHGRATAWVVEDLAGGRGRAALRTLHVTEPMGDGEWLEVRDGLRAGDVVIVEPPAGLAAGTRVRVQEAR
jgi:RND family efflux transporter MFP subunit